MALLEAIVQWWSLDNNDSWEWEQEGVSAPLREWTLCARDHPALVIENVIVNSK